TEKIHKAVAPFPQRERKTLFVGAIALIADPDSLIKCRPLKKNLGLRDRIAKQLNISPTAISHQLNKARSFYKTYRWFRDELDKVVNNLNNMKNKDLIEILKGLDPEKDVCIFDWRKNLGSDLGDGSSEGIYRDIKIIEMDEIQIQNSSKPWIAITFENEDYEKDGSFIDPYYR